MREMTGIKMVNTVLGPVATDQLGKTLMHEHFFFGFPGYIGNSLYVKDREEVIIAGLEFAAKVKMHGVQTIVDPTPNECGRDPELLKEISERSELNIICGTGYYYENQSAPAYFRNKLKSGQAEEEIYELFMGEVTDGIGRTGVKPGIIKLASGKGCISPLEEVFFRIAAKVQRETGITIITHTQEGTMGPEQADLLISEGADPNRILIGHMCGNTDINYHIRTLEKGVYVGFDRFGFQVNGRSGTPMDSARVEVLHELIKNGYENKVMKSHDTVNVFLGKPIVRSAEAKRLLENWHGSHIFENIIPTLQTSGVTDKQIQTILVDNPRRIFGEALVEDGLNIN